MRWFTNCVENTNSYIAKDGSIFHNEKKAYEYDKNCKIKGVGFANISSDIQELINKYKIGTVHQYNPFTDEDKAFTLIEFENEEQFDEFIDSILMKHLRVNTDFIVGFYHEYNKIGVN